MAKRRPYNPAGQLTARTRTDTGQASTYTYDAIGNLKHVLLADSSTIDYLVDGLNRRIGKQVNGTLVQGLLYANQLKPIAELDGGGHRISTFIYADRTNTPSYQSWPHSFEQLYPGR